MVEGKEPMEKKCWCIARSVPQQHLTKTTSYSRGSTDREQTSLCVCFDTVYRDQSTI